jgi:hypothetical protein
MTTRQEARHHRALGRAAARRLLPVVFGERRRQILAIIGIPAAVGGAALVVGVLPGLPAWRLVIVALAAAAFALAAVVSVTAWVWMRADGRRALPVRVRVRDENIVEQLTDQGDLDSVDPARRETALTVIERRRATFPAQLVVQASAAVVGVAGSGAVLAAGASLWTLPSFGTALIYGLLFPGFLEGLGRTELVASALGAEASSGPVVEEDPPPLPRLYPLFLAAISVSFAVFVLDIALGWDVAWIPLAAPIAVLAGSAHSARVMWKQSDPAFTRKRAAPRPDDPAPRS